MLGGSAGTAAVSEQCWLVLVPFYAALFVALGLIAVIAPFLFGNIEAGVVLAGIGFAHFAQGYSRMRLPADLYIKGKAWPATQMQYTLTFIDGFCVLLLLVAAAHALPSRGNGEKAKKSRFVE